MDETGLYERSVSGLQEALHQRLPALPVETAILDIGCGTGKWLDGLGQRGFTNLHGIDLDVAQFATRRASCSQANLDYDDIGLGDRKFGLITAIELVEHLENPGRLLFHVNRHLADDGYFLLTTPNIQSVVARLRFLLTGKLKQFDDKGDPTHISPVLLYAFRKVLDRHGLEICEKWPYPTDGSSITSRPSVKLVSALLSKVFPDHDPGDILCLLMRKRTAPPAAPLP